MMDEKRIESAIKEISEETELFKKLLGDDDEWNEVIQLGIDIKKTAIEALEKQLPKKPKENGMYSWIFKKTKTYTCPTCGNCCLEKMMNERQDTDFCWNCGQKLDWSE